MSRRLEAWLPGLVLLVAVSTARADEPKGPCTYGTASPCAPFGCVPDPADGPDVDRDQLAGLAGVCGKCAEDADCGGAKCNPDGTCARYDAPPVPGPIRPRFHLVVADVSLNAADADPPKPIIGVGYLFQVALREAKPVVRDMGGWITPDLPSFYANAGLSAAFAGPAQNLFVDAGVTYYAPGMPLALTTLSAGLLYQRLGPSIWNVSSDSGSDRLGPAATLGFLQNLYVRAAYVFPLRGPVDHGAYILSLVYMRDLAGDLVPDRFRKHLPKALQ